jgi:asparagine synthase (glutamine-hydrolysing)
MPIRFKLDRALRGIGHSPALWNPLWLAPVSPGELGELLDEPVELEELYSEAIELWDSCGAEHPVDRSLEFFGSLFLQDDILVKVDRMSMMHGLEVRSPFLDHDLVECVRRIPHGLKLHGTTTKYILKKALEPLLPTSIIHRQKVGFSAPLGQWLANGSLSVDAEALPAAWAHEAVHDKVRRHREGRDDHRLMLWNLFALSEFMKRDGARVASSAPERARATPDL